MKIGDRCFVHGYIDEIRKDTVIIKNSGGYFGTDPGEVITVYDSAHPNWILASKKLPEEDGEYLVLYYTRSKYKPYVYDVISFANDLYQIDEYDFADCKGQKGWFYIDRDYGYCEDNQVYAWMPLPEPYKEGAQE